MTDIFSARLGLPPAPGLARRALRMACGLRRWMEACAMRHRSRLDLAELDDHLRRDIGITAGAVRRESRKAFWMP